MNIKPATDPDARPTTRKQLLAHLWASKEFTDCDIFKEGPKYALRVGRFNCATGVRRIDYWTFAQWEQLIRDKRKETSQSQTLPTPPGCPPVGTEMRNLSLAWDPVNDRILFSNEPAGKIIRPFTTSWYSLELRSTYGAGFDETKLPSAPISFAPKCHVTCAIYDVEAAQQALLNQYRAALKQWRDDTAKLYHQASTQYHKAANWTFENLEDGDGHHDNDTE